MIKMSINNFIKIVFLLIILSIEIGQSLNLVKRNGHSSVLVDKKLIFLGGQELFFNQNIQLMLDQMLYLDVSKPFNTENPPFEEMPNTIPFKSSYATAFLSSQKNIIYLFGGYMRDVNTDLNIFNPVFHSYNLETNEWSVPTSNGITPSERVEINGVINNETGKFYVFGGDTNQETGSKTIVVFNDMNIFDINSLTWSKGSTINAPLPRIDYTATLLSNGIIVFIGGRETNAFNDVDINQLALYDTKVDKWLTMTAQGVTLENRNCHSAVLTPDEKIIIFGGSKGFNETIVYQLAVLDTKQAPYEWSIPQVSALDNVPKLQCHTATLIENYMFINFGVRYETTDELQIPYFFILDIRNFTWVTQFEPEQLNTTTNNTVNINNNVSPAAPANPSNSPTMDNSKIIYITLGTVGLSIGVGTVVGVLGYKFYKKQKSNRAIPTAGE
ncbi:hypothetical protein GLOIN_2v1532917 [Rhizophagus clarus]|uniref:Galactose oxidase n=1 Tax=Rhizophagus clarus TaxID=94130 RepID=A0A8H3LX04_9GLOM|nr:hypothetical protein GLOIN_2v1532917 [Rhizophagus clarus]